MTFPSDRLISDYQANARITLTGVCLKTPTKTHFSNDNFTAACVTYYENTTNFMFKINGSNPMAQFMVINNRMEIRAHDRSRVTIPSAFHKKNHLLNGKIWINLQNGHFKLSWDHYNFKPDVYL